MWEMRLRSLGWEDPLEEGIATHSSILAWEILWTEEPGRLQSMGHKESDTTAQLSLSQGLSICETTQEVHVRYYYLGTAERSHRKGYGGGVCSQPHRVLLGYKVSPLP